MAVILFLVVVFSGEFSSRKMENMLTNAIQAEVEAWNWSQRFVQAKFQPAKTENKNYVPAQLKFYSLPKFYNYWPTHETELKSSPFARDSSVISHI